MWLSTTSTICHGQEGTDKENNERARVRTIVGEPHDAIGDLRNEETGLTHLTAKPEMRPVGITHRDVVETVFAAEINNVLDDRRMPTASFHVRLRNLARLLGAVGAAAALAAEKRRVATRDVRQRRRIRRIERFIRVGPTSGAPTKPWIIKR
jgi:hypothetical protein